MGKPRKISLAEAKARFAEYVRAAEDGGQVLLTRHGKVVAALVNAEEWTGLQRLRNPRGGLASLAGGWEGSEELLAHLPPRARTGSRRAPALD